ncbi:MAG: hypothetical protein E7191_01570 [Erysipelotrichaceae bacterium]|nr:hypothetical protein [Erysipelotrichaceae bacterium]
MKKVIIMLFCVLLIGCSKTYTKEFSVREMSQVNLKLGTVITFENDTITISGKSQEMVDSTECYLDFKECTSEGLCYVSVICDNDEVSVDLPEIYVNAEYYYQRYSEIPEFINNFTDGEYHASDEFPMLLMYSDDCADDTDNVGATVDPQKCEVLKKDYDDYYVVYPTNHLWPNHENATIVSYDDALQGSSRYLMDISMIPVEERAPDQKYLEEDHKVELVEALNELEIVAFYPEYMYYWYNEENCYNRHASLSFTKNKPIMTIEVYQYADPETAFVEVRTNYGDGFETIKMYVRTHSFFEKLDKILEGIKGINATEPCPVSIE